MVLDPKVSTIKSLDFFSIFLTNGPQNGYSGSAVCVVLLGTRFLRVWPKKVFFHKQHFKMTSNTSKWQATHKFLLFFMILTVFHEFLPFFTNLSWQAINLWKIGEICEKTVKIKEIREKTPFWVKRGEILVPTNPTRFNCDKY